MTDKGLQPFIGPVKTLTQFRHSLALELTSWTAITADSFWTTWHPVVWDGVFGEFFPSCSVVCCSTSYRGICGTDLGSSQNGLSRTIHCLRMYYMFDGEITLYIIWCESRSSSLRGEDIPHYFTNDGIAVVPPASSVLAFCCDLCAHKSRSRWTSRFYDGFNYPSGEFRVALHRENLD